MRILVFSDEFPPLGNRKAFAVYYVLKYFKNRLDCEIDLVTTSRTRKKKEMYGDNVFVHYIDIGRSGGDTSLTLMEKCIYTWKALSYYNRYLRKKKYEIAHFFSAFSAYLMMKKVKLPTVVTLFPTDLYGRTRLIKHYYVKKVLSYVNEVVCSCKADLQIVQRFQKKKPLRLIYNGVMIKKFVFNLRPVNKKITLVSVGRMNNKRDYNKLIDAVSVYTDVRLIIIGDGIYKKHYEDKILKNGLDVEFTGRLKHEEIRRVMHKSDLYVSITSFDGISNSMLEAMSIGLPIICYDVGGNKEVINENGMLLSNDDPDAMVKAIGIYRDNRRIIKKHGRNSRVVANKFSWKVTGELYRNLYKNMYHQK